MLVHARPVLRNIVLAATFGLTLATMPATAGAASNSPAVLECVRNIALQERTAARQYKGAERRAMIKKLGRIKVTCMNGKIEQAYSAAARLRSGPQTAMARR